MIKTVQNAFVLKQGIYGGYDQWSIFGKSNKNIYLAFKRTFER